MRIFKSRKFKAVWMLVCVCGFLIAFEAVFSYFLLSVNSSMYFKYELEQYEKEGLEADMLFLGSSRVFEGFVPEVFEKELGMGLVINGGSATQRPESSYYLLKDMYRRFKPKVLVMGVQWNGILEESTDSQKMESVLTAYDRMSLAGRLEYIPAFLLSDQLPNFSNIYRCRGDFRFEKMLNNARKRRKLETEGHTPDTSADSYYYGKGFYYSNTRCERGNIPIMDENQDTFSTDIISKEKIKYLDKICDFCAKHGIKLILVASPISMMNMYHINGYQEAVDYFNAYAQEKGVCFDNLNFLKDREEWLGDDMMTDYIHLYGGAAMEVSSRYAQILKKHLDNEDVSGFFYKDLDELKAQVHRVAAVKAKFAKDEADEKLKHVSIEALGNEPENFVYSVEISFDEGASWERLEDKCGLEAFDLDTGSYPEGTMIKISVGLGEDDPECAWQIYTL